MAKIDKSVASNSDIRNEIAAQSDSSWEVWSRRLVQTRLPFQDDKFPLRYRISYGVFFATFAAFAMSTDLSAVGIGPDVRDVFSKVAVLVGFVGGFLFPEVIFIGMLSIMFEFGRGVLVLMGVLKA